MDRSFLFFSMKLKKSGCAAGVIPGMNDLDKIPIEPESRPMANPAVLFREVLKDEAVLVNMDSGASIAINNTGILVWKLSDGQRTVEQIVRAYIL